MRYHDVWHFVYLSNENKLMTYVPDYMTPQPPPPGRTGLMVFGIISIILGALAGCSSLMLPVALFASKMAPPGGTPAMNVGGIVIAMAMYVAIATGFIWVGIGSCQCRRWVRPLVLCVAWPWMVMGLLSSIIMVPMMSDMSMPPSATMPAQVRTVVFLVTGTMMVIMYILLPLAYILYYQRRCVQETLNLCDPVPRWSERCPMPVLGLSIWLLMMGLGILSMLQYRCVPLFGTYVTGLPAVGVILALAAVVVFASRACYHLRPIGWWIALLVVALWTLSTVLTFAFTGIVEFYRHSGMPQDQLTFMEQQPFIHGRAPLLMVAIFWAAGTAYLLYVRRYFIGARPLSSLAVTPPNPDQ